MEMLLQLMLKWDPVQRGGKTNADSKKPQCFEVLEQILCMKVSSVMYHTVFLELTIVFQILCQGWPHLFGLVS